MRTFDALGKHNISIREVMGQNAKLDMDFAIVATGQQKKYGV